MPGFEVRQTDRGLNRYVDVKIGGKSREVHPEKSRTLIRYVGIKIGSKWRHLELGKE